MPGARIPVEIPCGISDTDSVSVDENYKMDGSERSSSPKSDGSVSEVSEVSDTSLNLEFEIIVEEEHLQDILIEDFDKMKITEEDAEEMIKNGADMRHVLCTSWKLQPKFVVGKKVMSKSAGLVRAAPGQALRDMADAQKLSVEEHERSARYGFNPPPGFEYRPFDPTVESNVDPILVSYADGSNTLTLANEPLCLHNITVSCVVDSCHVFIQQMLNPTFEGVKPLEEDMGRTFAEEAPPALLRPIATGSLLAVLSGEKWYRCQVVSFNKEKDTCEIKFVDHGGYTTVQVSELRPLRSDFVRLPFQALEVYIGHINPATDEIVIDIASDLLFRENVSIQLLGYAEDGVPVIQAYFYQGDFINLYTQEILEDCYRVYKLSHPEHQPIPTLSSLMSDTSSVCCSEDVSSEEFEEKDIEDVSTDEGVWSPHPEDVSSTSSPDLSLVAYTPEQTAAYSPEQSIVFAPEQSTLIYTPNPTAVVYTPELSPVYSTEGEDQLVSWVPVPQPVIAYYVPDPATGHLIYCTAPLVPAPCYPEPYYTEDASPEQVAEIEETEAEKPFEEWTQEDYLKYYGME
jgi:hypothetical protein